MVVTPRHAFFFFFNDTATTEIYTLSLHDALPICHLHRLSLIHDLERSLGEVVDGAAVAQDRRRQLDEMDIHLFRSEEHTSELQSQSNLVCRLLLEKKKNNHTSRRTCPNVVRAHST